MKMLMLTDCDGDAFLLPLRRLISCEVVGHRQDGEHCLRTKVRYQLKDGEDDWIKVHETPEEIHDQITDRVSASDGFRRVKDRLEVERIAKPDGSWSVADQGSSR